MPDTVPALNHFIGCNHIFRIVVPADGFETLVFPFFGYEEKPGEAMLDSDSVVRAHELTRAETVLLFAEIPALTLTSKIKAKTGVTALPPCKLNGSNGDKACDSCLLYKSKSGNESIGFNHFRGKQLIGHVAFADGHVEAVVAPRNGNFVELTDWLCRGCDVSYREGSYEKVFDPKDKDNQN